MPRVCPFTGKKTTAGGNKNYRGRAKYLGGVGKRITSRNKRTFKANMQRVRAVIDGQVCRINVSTKAIKMGLVVKPLKRDWTPETDA